jgi:hypothetical protein
MDMVIERDGRLPNLGWLARVEPSGRVVVHHGPQVEAGDGWIVEGVWDGPFGSGFAESAHLFGSGIRVTNDAVTFVPSCALVDRLLWADLDGELLVSNSLTLLLAATGWRLPADGQVARSLYAIMRGIDTYDTRIPTTTGTIHQLYYHNLEVSRGRRNLRPKAIPSEIGSYEAYRSLLVEATERLGQNLAATGRRCPVRPLATISRGYDSPTVSAVARLAGVRSCFTSARSNSLVPSMVSRAATNDDGTAVAQALGLDAQLMNPGDGPAIELLFLAGSDEPEFLFGGLAQKIEASQEPAALFTGYHGDMLWRVDAFDDARAAVMIRHDVSGLNLCEVRLKAGFFNVPLTFLYARSQASLGRISRSDEMRPWRTWTDYDRPIPRRLLSELGVDGSLFGQRKKAIVQRPALPSHSELRRAFLDAVHQETGCSSLLVKASRSLDTVLALPLASARRLGWRLGKKTFVRPAGIRWRLYSWAVNRLASEYATTGIGGQPR